jgi:hypothetical protein
MSNVKAGGMRARPIRCCGIETPLGNSRTNLFPVARTAPVDVVFTCGGEVMLADRAAAGL